MVRKHAKMPPRKTPSSYLCESLFPFMDFQFRLMQRIGLWEDDKCGPRSIRFNQGRRDRA